MDRFIDILYGAFISKAFLKAEGFQVNDAQLNNPGWKHGVPLCNEVGEKTDFRVMNIPEELYTISREFNVVPDDFYLIYMYVRRGTRIEDMNVPDTDIIHHLTNETHNIFNRTLDKRISRECFGKQIYCIYDD